MPAAISYTPTIVNPGTKVTLDITGGAPGRVAEFALTSVPSGSSLSTGALTDSVGKAFIPEPAFQEANKRTSYFTPDVAGVYGLRASIIRVKPGIKYQKGYTGHVDPGNVYQRILEGYVDGSVYVGMSKKLRIAGAGHEVTLEIVVGNSTVVSAALTNPKPGAVALAATLDSTVLTKLAALVGQSVSTMGEDLVTGMADYRDKFNAHLQSVGGAHYFEDTVNPIGRGLAGSVPAVVSAMNDAYDHTIGHLQGNSAGWHTGTDFEDVPIAAKASDWGSAYVLYADLTRRVYSRHLGKTASTPNNIHQNADTTHTLAAAISPLSDVVVAVLDYFASKSPTIPAGQNPGDVAAESRYGFR